MLRVDPSGSAEASRTVPQLFRDIIAHIEEIFRSEIRLANAEIKQQVSSTAKASTALAAGLVLGLYGLQFLLLALALGLGELLQSWWGGALIVGAGLAVFSGVMVMIGMRRVRGIHPPERTLRSVKENLSWHKSPH